MAVKTATIAWVVAFEVMLAFWIRDNLTLNILMLLYPIRFHQDVWQAAGMVVFSRAQERFSAGFGSRQEQTDDRRLL